MEKYIKDYKIYFTLSWVCQLLILVLAFFTQSSLIYKITIAVIIIFIAYVQYIIYQRFYYANVNEIEPERTESKNEIQTEPDENTITASDLNLKQDNEVRHQSDEEFVSHVKDIVVTIRNHFDGLNAAIYWYNSGSNSYKLLTSTDNSKFTERFAAGNEIFSQVTAKREAVIVNVNDAAAEKEKFKFYNTEVISKSIIISPLIMDDEIMGIVLCDSKLSKYFDEPNLETLKIFTKVILIIINYFSIKEEYDFDKYVISTAFETVGRSNEQLIEIINRILKRYLKIDSLNVLVHGEKGLRFGSDTERIVHPESISAKAFDKGKFILCDFIKENVSDFRYFPEEPFKRTKFCAMPVTAAGKKMGVITFDTSELNSRIQNSLLSVYRLVVPIFSALYLSDNDRTATESSGGFYNGKYFRERLKKEIEKNRSFNDNSTIFVYASYDNYEELKKNYNSGQIEEYLMKELKKELNDYDMIFRIKENLYALIINLRDDDIAYVEFERIRKEISSRIFNADNKNFSTSISLALKRYNIDENDIEIYLKDLDKMMIIAKNEGGNITKLY